MGCACHRATHPLVQRKDHSHQHGCPTSHLLNCFPDELPWPQSSRPTANVNLTSPGPSQAPGQRLHPCEPQFSGKLVPFHDAEEHDKMQPNSPGCPEQPLHHILPSQVPLSKARLPWRCLLTRSHLVTAQIGAVASHAGV